MGTSGTEGGYAGGGVALGRREGTLEGGRWVGKVTELLYLAHLKEET